MTYLITISDGCKIPISADSASEAIGMALASNYGKTAIKCSSGEPGAGWIEYEIPTHKPLNKPVLIKKNKSEPGLFDDTEIKRESARAKSKASY